MTTIVNPAILIIKLLLNKDNYNKYNEYLYINSNISKELKTIYKLLGNFFEKFDRDASLDEMRVFVLAQITKNQEWYQDVFDQLVDVQVGEDILLDTLHKLKEQSIAEQIALKALEVSQGQSSPAALNDLMQQLDSVTVEEEEEDPFVTDDLETLVHNVIQTMGLRWRLGTMNRMLGSLRKGNFGFIVARPETGKTTFLASEVTYMAEQLGENDGPILWINNEEEGQKVKLRCYQACLGIPMEVLLSNIPKYRAEYANKIKGKLLLLDRATITKKQVEEIAKKYKPSLIVFDQLDKIKGFQDDRDDLRLGAIYIWARELAKEYCPVIGVTQADVSGENKKWLTMENVANAKTSKQAEADWILGIGKLNNEGYEYIRHLHLSKNKLYGDEDTDPELKHGRQDVIIEPFVARYKDIN